MQLLKFCNTIYVTYNNFKPIRGQAKNYQIKKSIFEHPTPINKTISPNFLSTNSIIKCIIFMEFFELSTHCHGDIFSKENDKFLSQHVILL